jgi:hypothetical protein
MKIIGTGGTKTFKVIPRQYVDGQIQVKLTNESTKGVVTVSATATTDHDYMSFEAVFGTLKKDVYYTMDVLLFGTSTVIYKDKVFCTDQTVDQSNNDYYTVNENEYTTEDSYDNDYIII